MNNVDKKRQLAKSATVAEIPLACSNELAAVEFLEKQRWGNTPACVKCGSVEVYKMADAKTGERNKRFLWRCRDCKEQYTVRLAQCMRNRGLNYGTGAMRSGVPARPRRASPH